MSSRINRRSLTAQFFHASLLPPPFSKIQLAEVPTQPLFCSSSRFKMNPVQKWLLCSGSWILTVQGNRANTTKILQKREKLNHHVYTHLWIYITDKWFSNKNITLNLYLQESLITSPSFIPRFSSLPSEYIFPIRTPKYKLVYCVT